MRLELKYEKNYLYFDSHGQKLAKIQYPVILEGWNGKYGEEECHIREEYNYDRINASGSGAVTAAARIVNESLGEIEVTDCYERTEKKGIVLTRKLRINKKGSFAGVRLLYEMQLFPESTAYFEDLRYFAPPAIYDKNDLDEDGYEDYFHTRKTIFRDDRFNYPMFMAWKEEEKIAIRLERDPVPAFDSNPVRTVCSQSNILSPVFLQKTDIGSMGVNGDGHQPVKMTACYPFYEGDATIGLYIIKTVPFGAYWPLEEGEELQVSYRISADEYEGYQEACWESIARVIREKQPQAKPLAANPEILVDYRLKALEQYYVEKTKEEDENEPAGYVLNCHPQDGIQLENIIQYGFTGQNIMNAYNVLRYGIRTGNTEYVRKAVKTANFFASVIHIKESGMFYNLYNIDMKKVNFWWTGLLLPLAYADGEELSELMGPLYEYRKEVIDTLAKHKGAYLRCMNEDVISLLRIYLLEKERGIEHGEWKEAVLNYGEFLLRTQEEDGSWYRAYDLEGKAVTEPEIWFGATIYEKKSSTGTSISLLVELYRLTKDNRYLAAAEKAGKFVGEYIIDRVRFNGGVHDSIYAKGQLIDNESILYPMFGMLSLYEETKKTCYLEEAHKAARLTASWVCLWNVPLPEDSTLYRYGFNSIGMGACDTCGCGYVHPFQLLCVAEIAQIAIDTGDRELFETAALYWFGCNQTVSLPENDWGYAAYGLQEEGYLVSWWAVDDPMFSADTGFGNRLKGEGNKTCFPWINAVGVKAYWSLLDRFGTTDFDEIREKYFKKQGGGTNETGSGRFKEN